MLSSESGVALHRPQQIIQSIGSYTMNMSLTKKKMITVLFLSMFGMLSLSACESNDGPVEELGEKVDEVAEDAKRGIEDATD